MPAKHDGFLIFSVLMTHSAPLPRALPTSWTAIVAFAMICCVHVQARAESDTARARQNLPGEVTTSYTAAQDSAYRLALKAPLSGNVRFAHDARTLAYTIETKSRIAPQESAWEAITRTMNVPSSIYAPTAQEVVQHRINIANAQYVPGILLYPMGTGNMQVNLGDIAKMFGLQEDVSPRIRYTVDETTEIQIVIYSPQARIITTLFSGIQAPGQYEVNWNGQDDQGHPVFPGDFVAEVRIGTDRITRKRIVWPPR